MRVTATNSRYSRQDQGCQQYRHRHADLVRVRSSVYQMVIERLDGTYNEQNEFGQYPLYNKVAGVVVTGNEDGAHSARDHAI
jgi:hypothetical protein